MDQKLSPTEQVLTLWGKVREEKEARNGKGKLFFVEARSGKDATRREQ